MARSKGETKPERIARAVAQAVHAGKEWHLPVVDFNDPARPKTCLEVDFPILPINHVAAIEGNAGKPIYQMSKWWARRRSSVFRAMLIAAATKAPDDPAEAAKLVWDAYYGNHQKNEAFRRLKVADIFMGGGTTVVEGARLGMQMYGNDLNPVAWFVVKNELAQVDPADVQKLLDHIEAEVKPQIMPFYACDCPRGHKGKWTHKPTQRVMGPTFDPLALTPEQRPEYEYEGPEVIYTFWSKHGRCQNAECGHRTPIMSSPVVAVKTLSVGVWRDRECAKCGQRFDVEADEARMAPAALFVCSPEEPPYTIRNGDGSFDCPNCNHVNRPALGNSDSKDKKIDLTLLVHHDWLKGAQGKAAGGLPFGGSVTDDAESTARWNAERAKTLKLIEVRGPLPDEIVCPDTRQTVFTDARGGTAPASKNKKDEWVAKKSTFNCHAATCGREHDVLDAIKESKKSGPTAMYAVQGYCPACDKAGRPYSGRFFDTPKVRGYDVAHREWEQRRDADLAAYWPRSEVPFGFMTSMNNGGIPNHGFTHWWTMFNSKQLLILTQLLRSLSSTGPFAWDVREFVLGAFQQYLRNQNLFCIWDEGYDKLVPHMSNNNYHPKSTMVENSVFSKLGRGNWKSCVDGIGEGLSWCGTPWEALPTTELEKSQSAIAEEITGKSVKVYPGDPVGNHQLLDSVSSTGIRQIADGSYDLVITDPPFGGLLHYSELADFFYVWLRLALKEKYPDKFTAEYTPKALEAVANRARQPEDPDAFYQKILTECWREAARILKPSGILSFTFHHSEDEPWVAVLESLFQAGFYLEAAYPIRSDETKGEGAKPGTFGSQLIEYDIIHVCRKRTGEPDEVSWARLRRQINQDVRQLQDILTKHQTAGLQEADLQVIRRGKALEYYSKHYGKVYVEKGREFTVREALLAINQLLDDQADTSAEAPPVLAEPYTRQFFRLFADKTSLPRDQMSKYLRGTGVSPQEFIDRGWCSEKSKVFTPITPLDWAQSLRGVRRSNAFAKHDRLIASIDTLKMRPRLKRLQEAPAWDLVVFDEAHHLTAYRRGTKVEKTENYRLAEALKVHSRDLLLLSATPHQGDHFRFWMLSQLLDGTLFRSPDDMVENRHRLNSVVFRRTKADACRPDGSTLFARRWVHTESFVMSDDEREFYNALQVYLMDGFALARRQGNKGRALGFVMTIFQKIAASSFAAVHRTLRRRLIALAVQEGLLHDGNLEIDARDAAFAEAKELIRREFGLGDDRMSSFEADRILADLKRRLLRKMSEEELDLASSEYSSETVTTYAEDAAINAVELALPEERQRIRELLRKFPKQVETKVEKLIHALGTLWRQDANERVVVFATYLGSVEMLGQEIEKAYPGQGVVVLKGGDHGSKLAAEKRFKQADGPKVMICTAAGREGINLQHARVLFNFDLPWNPMDLEQRIGRIHRYGQRHTAQVYNLVLSDTIEGKIFLLLNDKLTEIAKALGKVDERGEVAEDLRTQILGQLSERLNYESLYTQAVSDPELKRTRLELEAALSNAAEARQVVFELFQDLDRFSLDDYQQFSDTSEGMGEIVRFLRAALEEDGKSLADVEGGMLTVRGGDSGAKEVLLTTAREESLARSDVELLGLDHPLVVEYMAGFRALPAQDVGVRVRAGDQRTGVLSLWHVTTQGERGELRTTILPLAVDFQGQRIPSWERQIDGTFQRPPATGGERPGPHLLAQVLEPMLQRELLHRGVVGERRGYDARLIGWVEVV